LTKRSRRIHNSWHFWFDSALVFTAQWFRLGGGVVHPLMRRYKHWHSSKNSNVHSLIKLLIGIYAQ
ncbi:hypothetical protein ACEV85_23280, partial [Vibrio parahaemolyticus]